MASRVLLLESAAVPAAQLRLWGGFELLSGAWALPRSRKARAILAYLALNPGRAVRRERLMGLLWGSRCEEQARASLRQAIAELRPLAQGAPPALAVDREALTLAPLLVRSDVDIVREAAAAGDWGRLTGALPAHDDRLLDGFDGLDEGFDEWLTVERVARRDWLGGLVADAIGRARGEGRDADARRLMAWLSVFDPDVARGLDTVAVLASRGLASSDPPAPPPHLAVGPPPTTSHRHPRRWLLVGAGIASAAALVASFAARDPWPAPTNAASVAAAAEVDPRVVALHASAVLLAKGRKLGDARVIIDLMEQALVIDPRFAPGWAMLAHAQARLALHELAPDGDHAALLRAAERNARRAVALAPNLAQAHGTLGMVLGQGTPEAREHIRRASELDPNDPELLFWYSNVLGTDGEHEAQLAALARVITLDPGFQRGLVSAALLHWEMGDGAASERIARSATGRPDVAATDMATELDWARGDVSRIAERALALRAIPGLERKSGEMLGLALLTVGRTAEARLLLGWSPEMWRVAAGGAPSPAELVELDRKAAQYRGESAMLASALNRALGAGRAAEIVAAHDSGIGALASASLDTPTPDAIVHFGPEVALALRAVGRTGEADAILDRAAVFIATAKARGRIPNWLHAGAARVHAARGERDLALAELTAAVARGWRHMPWAASPDIAEFAAFRPLSGDPRFEASRAILLGELARERRELAALGV